MGAPSASEIRAHLDDDRHQRSYWKAIGLFVIVFGAYLLSLVGAIVAPWYLKPFLIVANGVTIGILFVIGHDSCHRTYSPSRTLDGWIGRLSFLPSLWMFSAWRLLHNYFHHGFTCLRDKDTSWHPCSWSEFKQSNRTRKWLTRHTKSWAGCATHWIFEVWWLRSFSLSKRDWEFLSKRRFEYYLDYVLVVGFFLTEVALISYVSWNQPGTNGMAGAMLAVLAYLVIPFWIYSFLAGLVTMVQHTHPKSIWFKDKQEWNFFASQISDTVHFKFPFPINKIFLDVMEHNAHHVDTSIPLYNLIGQQRALEEAYPEHITIENFSITTINRIFKTCQLYDYDKHCWVSFDGQRTTEPVDLNDLVPGAQINTAPSSLN